MEPLEPIHHYFGLSYANLLVLYRAPLQSMPNEWQQRFVQCLEELDEAFPRSEGPTSYQVQPRDQNGKYTDHPYPHYDRGRTVVRRRES